MLKKHLAEVPDEVINAQLDRYTDEALSGRLAHYQREALLERDPELRAKWKYEAFHTKAEIERRRAEKRVDAEALFKKPA